MSRKILAQLSWAWKKVHNLRVRSICVKIWVNMLANIVGSLFIVSDNNKHIQCIMTTIRQKGYTGYNKQLFVYGSYLSLILFPPFTTIVVFSLISLCTLVPCIANTMDSDQTAPFSPSHQDKQTTLKPHFLQKNVICSYVWNINPLHAKHSGSRQQSLWFLHDLWGIIGVEILCELSAGRRFTWNVKSYYVTKNSNKIWKCRLLQIVSGTFKG